jgi:hypothetical protein
VARFYIGQPVVCVDDRMRPSVARNYPQITNWPKAGKQYTIRGNITKMTQVARNRWTPLTFVTVRELTNPIIAYGDGSRAEAGFHEDRFEPATNIDKLVEAKDKAPNFFEGGKPDWDRKTKRRTRKKEDA